MLYNDITVYVMRITRLEVTMEKKLKVYKLEGKEYTFNTDVFKNLFKDFKKTTEKKTNKKITNLDLEYRISEYVNIGSDAVHAWYCGGNAPIGIEFVQKLAEFFQLQDFHLLLLEKKEEVTMQITERQKDSLKRIYDAIIDYLEKFLKTDGFNDLWFDFRNQGYEDKHIESKLYDTAEYEQDKVMLVVKKEYIELHRLPVYNQIVDYVQDTLTEVYNCKLSYAYRFEAGVENMDGTRTTKTTSEDYWWALREIHNIRCEYM